MDTLSPLPRVPAASGCENPFVGKPQTYLDDMLAGSVYEMVFGDGNAVTEGRIKLLLAAGADITKRKPLYNLEHTDVTPAEALQAAAAANLKVSFDKKEVSTQTGFFESLGDHHGDASAAFCALIENATS